MYVGHMGYGTECVLWISYWEYNSSLAEVRKRKISGVVFYPKLRKFLIWWLNRNTRELRLNCSWKASALASQKSLILKNLVFCVTFKEQLAEIVEDVSDKVVFKLMVRIKKLASGQISPSFVVPVSKGGSSSCLSCHCSPSLCPYPKSLLFGTLCKGVRGMCESLGKLTRYWETWGDNTCC